MRVPCIMRWPGRIPAGHVCREVATTMDILPTAALLAGAEAPQDRIVDGKDIRPLLWGDPAARSPYEAFYYYRRDELEAVRSGRWKLVFERMKSQEYPYKRGRPEDFQDEAVPEALYDLATDVGETANLIEAHPEEAERLRDLAERMREDLGDSRTGREGKNRRPVGKV